MIVWFVFLVNFVIEGQKEIITEGLNAESKGSFQGVAESGLKRRGWWYGFLWIL
jgi:hypothetical protein